VLRFAFSFDVGGLVSDPQFYGLLYGAAYVSLLYAIVRLVDCCPEPLVEVVVDDYAKPSQRSHLAPIRKYGQAPKEAYEVSASKT